LKKIKNYYFSEQPKCCARVQTYENNPKTYQILWGFSYTRYS